MFYPFFRVLPFFPRFTPFSAFYPFFRVLPLFPRFTLFSAFYPFFRVLPFFPRFTLFSASAIPPFRFRVLPLPVLLAKGTRFVSKIKFQSYDSRTTIDRHTHIVIKILQKINFHVSRSIIATLTLFHYQKIKLHGG